MKGLEYSERLAGMEPEYRIAADIKRFHVSYEWLTFPDKYVNQSDKKGLIAGKYRFD